MNLKTIMIQGSLGILLTAGLSVFSKSNVLASPFIWPGSVDITDATQIEDYYPERIQFNVIAVQM